MTIDKDQILVNQFIEALDKVSREMQPLDENDNIGYVLITKLRRVYEVYKDTVLSNNDFDYLIDYYSHLQTKEEETQVVENLIPLTMQLSKHKKMIDTAKVQSDKKEDKEVKKYEYPVKIDNTSEWYYEGFILILRNSPKFSFAECKEVGFYYSISAGLGHIIDEFRKAVDTKLQNDKEDESIQCDHFSESNTIIGIINDKEEEEEEEVLKEISEVTCEQDVWYNRDIRDMKNKRDLKILKNK